jgi:hypothetical protein
MTNFTEREKGQEAKYVHDSEMQFQVEAKRNKLIGTWAAQHLGLTGAACDAYVAEVIAADFTEKGSEDVFKKLAADFRTHNIRMSDDVIRAKLAEFGIEAEKSVGT